MSRNQQIIAVVAVVIVLLAAAGYYLFFPSSSPSDVIPATANASTSGPGYTVTADDHTLGSPKAPITLIEYAAPTCPHCAHFDMTMFPDLKKNYIDTGKVYYVFRVFPLSQVDVAAEAIARCLPADNYFQFIDLLFRNQPKWDPDGYDIPDPAAALVNMGRIAGMSADQVNTCMANPAEQKRVTDNGQEAMTKFGVQGTPAFFVNGEMSPPFESTDDVKKYLDQKLAQK